MEVASQVIKKRPFSLNYISDNFTPESKIYEHSNENLAQEVEIIPKNAKSVLTVGASGDQLLNLMVKGIYKVDTFDINKFTNYYINLRLAGIKTLKYDRLYNFLLKINQYDYLTARDALDSESRIFWDTIFSDGSYSLYSNLYRELNKEIEILETNNYFIKPDGITTLIRNVDQLKRQNFATHIFNLPAFIQDKKYDAIMLSNIADYVDTVQFLRYLRILEYYLNPGGVILYSYQYGVKGKTHKDIKRMLIRSKVEIINKYKEKDLDEFDDIFNKTRLIHLDCPYPNTNLYSSSEDAVLVYKKEHR